jgi:hypothetical protein
MISTRCGGGCSQLRTCLCAALPRPRLINKLTKRIGAFGVIKRERRRRSAIEPVIGHMKAEGHLGRCCLNDAGWLVILLALTHVSAALYHHLVRRDAVLKRMLPRAMGGF